MSSQNTARPTIPYSVVAPIVVGLALFIGLFSMINSGVISNDLVTRYLAGHVVSKVTTALFLIGMASLALIGWDIFRQRNLLGEITLNETRSKSQRLVDGDNPPEITIEQLQMRLEKFRGKVRRTWFWRRLQTALDFVYRNGTPDGVDEELKYAAEQDQDEKHDRYSFVRILVWAIPMLGFLGTVIGISEALGGIQISEDNDFQAMMGNLRSSLYVAFDTTAVALTFAIVLMFCQFAADRVESGLLTRVDARTREELQRHWDITNQSRDTYVQTVEAIGASMLESTEQLVDRQVKLWRANIDVAESAWVDSVRSAQRAVQQNLQESLAATADSLSDSLRETIQKSDEAVGRRWEQWQVALSENARLLAAHQEQLVDHSQNMMEILKNIGSLTDAKQAVAEYLQELPSSADYSEASEKLSVAIRLLEFRLQQMADGEKRQNTRNATGNESTTPDFQLRHVA